MAKVWVSLQEMNGSLCNVPTIHRNKIVCVCVCGGEGLLMFFLLGGEGVSVWVRVSECAFACAQVE